MQEAHERPALASPPAGGSDRIGKGAETPLPHPVPWPDLFSADRSTRSAEAACQATASRAGIGAHGLRHNASSLAFAPASPLSATNCRPLSEARSS